jgi:hypothetical protein
MQGKTRVSADSRVFLPGTVADRLMRSWLDSGDPTPGWMVAHADEMLERFSSHDSDEPDKRPVRWRGDPAVDRKKVLDFVVEVVSLLEPILLKLVVPYDYQPELKFRVPIRIPNLHGDPTVIYLIGGIDIVVRYPSQDFAAYDLKATTNESYVNKVLGQGVFYDIALGIFLGDHTQPKEFGFIIPATKQPVVMTSITNDDRRMMLARIVEYAHGIWRQEFEPTTEDAPCYTCEVKHACDRYAVPITEDESGKRRASFDAAVAKRRIPTVEGT